MTGFNTEGCRAGGIDEGIDGLSSAICMILYKVDILLVRSACIRVRLMKSYNARGSGLPAGMRPGKLYSI